MKITDIKRNDVKAALDYYRQAVAHNTLRPGDAEQLVMLQDDPAELRRRMAAIKVNGAAPRPFTVPPLIKRP